MADSRTRPPTAAALVVAAWLAAEAWAWAERGDGDAVVRGTARVAVALWALAAGLILTRRRPTGRAAWACGAAAHLIHVGVAFDYAHGWSHGSAFRHVEAASGFGPGIYVSYLFTLAWAADAAWWLAWPARYDRRPSWLDRTVHGFVAFVVFNGTVVYETGPVALGRGRGVRGVGGAGRAAGDAMSGGSPQPAPSPRRRASSSASRRSRSARAACFGRGPAVGVGGLRVRPRLGSASVRACGRPQPGGRPLREPVLDLGLPLGGRGLPLGRARGRPARPSRRRCTTGRPVRASRHTTSPPRTHR